MRSNDWEKLVINNTNFKNLLEDNFFTLEQPIDFNERSKDIINKVINTQGAILIGSFLFPFICSIILWGDDYTIAIILFVFLFLFLILTYITNSWTGTIRKVTIPMRKIDRINEFLKMQENPSFKEIKTIATLLKETEGNIISCYNNRFLMTVNYFSKNLISQYLNDSIYQIIEVSNAITNALQNNIEHERILLQNTKSEVEKNLSWTRELLAVSEAQKLRLDRQIEQFEELKKKLERM